MKKANLYTIESYGQDYSIEHLTLMYKRGDLVIPDFQRKYVWTQKQASQFIESCIIGLPVPPIFLFKEKNEDKFLVVDGQQRIQSLIYFRDGFFKNTKTQFKLVGVASDFDELTYKELPDKFRRRFDYAPIRVTIFKQSMPDEGIDSVYEVFSRLNTGGRKLTSHEVRNAILRGKINIFLKDLNFDENWRKLYGRQEPDIHMKDEELILRFLALHDDLTSYEPPMNLFLNKFMDKHKDDRDVWFKSKRDMFKSTTATILDVLGPDAFRIKKTLNSAVCDSLMVTFANNLDRITQQNKNRLKQKYQTLKINPNFIDSVETGTSHARRVKARMELVESSLFASLN